VERPVAGPPVAYNRAMPHRRHSNVVNQSEVEPQRVEQGQHQLVRRRLGSAAGGRQLGASLCELPPGARSYPFHWHGANEEALYVIEGRGLARLGDVEVAIGPGDYLAFPIGPAHAHQLINAGDTPLVYLCVGTEHRCEVVGYPDSNKLKVLAGESWESMWVNHTTRPEASLDYWDGEPAA
jgi:uncharacterized cupin superfamily protein